MSNENISSAIGQIRIARAVDARVLTTITDKWKSSGKIPFTEYNIKESDYRIKTATFTSPVFFDLTLGQYFVLIQSKYHENFSGIILDVDYDEKTGLYTYQCQDWSRNLISKFEAVGKFNVYLLLRSLITGNTIKYGTSYAKLKKAGWASVVSGLKSKDKYNQSYYDGNKYKGNPFDVTRQLVIRDKSYIEVIRDLVFNSLGFFDVWFNDRGVLQITPISRTDWESTGLHLTDDGYSNRKFKFSTTNAITDVVVNGQDLAKGSSQKSKDLIDLDLRAFFGSVTTSIQNPNNQTKAVTNNSSKNTTTKKTSTSNTSNNGNPFNKKAKKIIVSADKGGNPNFKDGIVKLLKKDGWTVKDLGIGPGTHSKSYNILSSKYAVNLTIYNGMCAGTIKETYDGWLKGKHEKYGVAHVEMWDTSTWTAKKGKHNKKGDWYHRNGDMSDYYLATAHDWNRGGNPVIKSVSAYFKKYKVLYCCGTTPANAYKQFKAGGYAKMKGLY